MSKLSDAKIMGVIGAILMLVAGYVPLGAIIGLVLIFLAVKYISEEAKEESIFNNYLMHFIFIIFALVATTFIIFYAIGGFDFLLLFKMLIGQILIQSGISLNRI